MQREKVFILLVREILRLGNMKAAYPLLLLGISKGISYKTVEILYFDPHALTIFNNLFSSSVRRKNISSVEASDDSTGYYVTATKQYRYIREREGKFVKEGKLVYSFGLVNLGTGINMGYAV